MGSQNLNSGNEIGGTSGKKALSVSQVTPVFSYRVSGGDDINVYFIQTKGAKIVIMTYGDPPNEYAYSTMTLFTNTGCEACALVFSAIRHWELENNPFIVLQNDSQAMRRLSKLLSEFHESE
jgi:hypothetical protein